MQQCNANELYGDDDDEYIHDDAMIPKRTALLMIFINIVIYTACNKQINHRSYIITHSRTYVIYPFSHPLSQSLN